jgi:hypothetical protein
MKPQWNESGGRVLLGNDGSGRSVMLRPIRCHCVGVWISLGLPCVCVRMRECVYAVDYVYSQFRHELNSTLTNLPDPNFSLRRVVSVPSCTQPPCARRPTMDKISPFKQTCEFINSTEVSKIISAF